MARVILLCGRICSGKTTYARALQRELPRAVTLSCDALMLTLFPDGTGEHHDMLTQRARLYLFGLSLDLLAIGADVILDWGFWTKAWRQEARDYYGERGISCELHAIDPSPEAWQRHMLARNEAVRRGAEQAYAVDDGLLVKLEALFEPPEDGEIDVLYRPD